MRVEVLNPPTEASILVGRSKTPALVAFLLAFAGSVALAYCLDNLSPAGGARDAAEADTEVPPSRRSGPPPGHRRRRRARRAS